MDESKWSKRINIFKNKELYWIDQLESKETRLHPRRLEPVRTLYHLK